MNKTLAVFECQNCGHSSPKWLGRCPDCGSWNSYTEEKRLRLSGPHGAADLPRREAVVTRLDEVSLEETPRIDTRNPELNRALGGGIVPGSLILLGGEPGVGKSTLLLQLAASLRAEGLRVLYASGEESPQQIRLRAERIAVAGAAGAAPAAVPANNEAERGERPAPGGDIFLVAESSLELIMEAIDETGPGAVVIDSVQTVCSETLSSAPGSVSQVRHAAMQLLTLAKSRNLPVFLIGHVTKDGSIAGPKALEHIVDVVLYFEGEGKQHHRIIRAVKNRFGAANEVGIFEMTTRGLLPAENPSRLFLLDRAELTAGSSVVCALEGTRPLLVEVQSLVVATQYGTGRRVATGVNYNRISVLTAMLEKRLGIQMAGSDIYVNTAGGLDIDEPGADLGIFASILGSLRNRPLRQPTVLLGELSLSGAVRPVTQAHLRVREAAAMGFQQCLLPAGNFPLTDPVEGIELVPIKTVGEASDILFG